jgi:hypothetical protein
MGLVLLELDFSVILFPHLTPTQKIEMMMDMNRIKAKNNAKGERCRPSLKSLKLESFPIWMITSGKITETQPTRVVGVAFITNVPTAARYGLISHHSTVSNMEMN